MSCQVQLCNHTCTEQTDALSTSITSRGSVKRTVRQLHLPHGKAATRGDHTGSTPVRTSAFINRSSTHSCREAREPGKGQRWYTFCSHCMSGGTRRCGATSLPPFPTYPPTHTQPQRTAQHGPTSGADKKPPTRAVRPSCSPCTDVILWWLSKSGAQWPQGSTARKDCPPPAAPAASGLPNEHMQARHAKHAHHTVRIYGQQQSGLESNRGPHACTVQSSPPAEAATHSGVDAPTRCGEAGRTVRHLQCRHACRSAQHLGRHLRCSP